MTDAPDDLTEIEALARAATPGEWEASETIPPHDGFPATWQIDAEYDAVCTTQFCYARPTAANAAHIAHMSPARTLRIVERLREAEGERDDSIVRWCIRMADIREASGVGVKPMLDEVPAAIRARVTTLEARATAAEARVAELEGVLREAGGWSGYEDEIAEAISDSMDMDWTSQDGARAVVRFLNTIAAGRATLAQGGEA